MELSVSGQSFRNKIGDTLCEFYANVSKFNIVAKTAIKPDTIKRLVEKAEFEEEKRIDTNLTEEEAMKTFYKNDTELAAKYLYIVNPLQSINDEMQNFCNDLNKVKNVIEKSST